MDVVVVGGSAAGLMTGLLLARDGHTVTVLERDDLSPGPDVEAAAAHAFRASAPQAVQPHALLPGFRERLREHLPDVHAALIAAGAVEAAFPDLMPPTLPDRTPQPGDERLTLILARRSTLDWVLARAAAIQEGLTIRPATRVLGPLASPGDPPVVHGVRSDQGEVQADLVVDASGRRSPIDDWLKGLGARPATRSSAECGLTYFSRHYRRLDDAAPGPPTTRIMLPLEQLNCGLWSADNGSVVVAISPLVEDRRFAVIRDPSVYEKVLATIPTLSPWQVALEPVTGVHPMAGLHNTMRRLVSDGRPVVLGLVTVGDSVSTTNPTFGRGLALALAGAVDLAASIRTVPDDLDGLARRIDAGVEVGIAPFYEDQARNDAARLVRLRHALHGGDRPLPAPAADPERVSLEELRDAMFHDADVLRAFWEVFGTLRPPEDVYCDPDIVAATRLANRGRPPMSLPQPDPAALAAALAG